jgi:YHS domain-containing protein
MRQKKTTTRKSRLLVCDMCGKAISKRDTSIVKPFDGYTYNFDSDDCLLVFRKLREIYGKNFFKPTA